MMKKLSDSFFQQNTIDLAKALLGKCIRVQHDNQWLEAIIIETEAYEITEKASHASLGFTQKRKACFMPPGTIYMYYSRAGDSFNVSALGEGNAVLIKSGIPHQRAKQFDQMIKCMQRLNPRKNSTLPRPIATLCSGQTLLCKSLGLTVKKWDQKRFNDHFYIADTEYRTERIIQTTRLGIPQGRDEQLPYRFIDESYMPYCTKPPAISSKKRVH